MLVALILAAVPVDARVLLTQDEALRLAFPDCAVERTTHYLTAAQVGHAQELAGEEPASAIVHRYQAVCGGRVSGTAYFDTHRVRTLSETLMIVVGTDGEVQRLEIVAFNEPEDYIPRGNWYEQFSGRPLSDRLNLKRDIRGVTGATLTARATTSAVRRALALHQTLEESAVNEIHRSGEGAGLPMADGL